MDNSQYIWTMALDWMAPLLIIGVIIVFASIWFKPLLSDKEMLQKRFESGQIDRETYEEGLKELEEA